MRSRRQSGGGPADAGRAGVTRDYRDSGAFKTPMLREVARTAPYMHDGSFPTLEAVIDFDDRGGSQNEHLDPEIHPLGLSATEKSDLVAFQQNGLSGSNGSEVRPPNPLNP